MANAEPATVRECRRQLFEAEVERLLDRLYGTAVRLTRNQADAEDLVSEALARAWAGLDSLRDPQAFEKWVFRVLVNSFISERRWRKTRPREEITDDGEGDPTGFSLFERAHQPFLLWWGNPEQQLLDKLLREDIARAFERLPEVFRVAVILVEVHGCSYAEAAETLGVPVGTLRSRLSRGRGLLQRELWRQANQLGIAVGGPKGSRDDGKD